MENSNNYISEENKKLLFIDLCGRIPYRIKIKRNNYLTNLSVIGIIGKNICHTPYYVGGNIAITTIKIDDVKPYLRPMSSMTEEEKEEYEMLQTYPGFKTNHTDLTDMYDWLNAHHFDYRGLIEKGLAIEAPEDMYTQTNI